ncbi:MAG: TIGR03986 family CRISPR-associated RAMP protein [Candidatus Sericytochromatia bacterium]
MGRQDRKKESTFSGGGLADLLSKAGLISTEDAKKAISEIEQEKSLPKQATLNLTQTKVSNNRKAKAPYNFVPLHEKVIEYKNAPDNDFFHTKDEYSNTGYIELEIETKTPLYIRDLLNKNELEKKEELEKKDKNAKFINSDFYSPTGKYAIPASSLRGMTRNLVEILSFSKIDFIGDKYLYFRSMADMCHSVKKNYMDKMHPEEIGESGKKTGKYIMSSGILYKKGLNYYITHCSDKPEEIDKSEVKKILNDKYKTYKYFDLNDRFIVIPGDAPPKKNKEGKLIYKEVDWIVNKKPKNDKDILIPKEDVISYLDDTLRDSKIPNLIKDAKEKSNGVPCFYVKWKDTKNNTRISFGYNPMFRLSYEKSIYDHIPEDHKNKDIIDITDSIFGVESKFATRVFFEDAIVTPDQKDVLMQEKTPKLLLGPKPTTFQHYLTQSTDNLKNLSHYNTGDSSIRGNKFYFHKSGQNWEEKDTLKNEKVSTKIKAIKPNVKFKGKIRFENLSDIELGALLQAIKLPQECYHKIGMGKPLGLGSIKITPKLYLSNRVERYKSFFSELEQKESNNIDDKIKIFQDFVKKELNHESDFWKIYRIKELKILLNYNKGLELEKKGETRYMTITGTSNNEFKQRPVLPLPSDM